MKRFLIFLLLYINLKCMEQHRSLRGTIALTVVMRRFANLDQTEIEQFSRDIKVNVSPETTFEMLKGMISRAIDDTHNIEILSKINCEIREENKPISSLIKSEINRETFLELTRSVAKLTFSSQNILPYDPDQDLTTSMCYVSPSAQAQETSAQGYAWASKAFWGWWKKEKE